MVCLCHCVHLCNSDQSQRLDSFVLSLAGADKLTSELNAFTLLLFVCLFVCCVEFVFVLAILCQDLPVEWMPPPPPKDSAVGEGKGKGKGRGAAKAKAKAKAATKADKADSEPAPKKKPEKHMFLTNLVRCGNQMSSSSSWSVVKAALRSLIRRTSSLLTGIVLQPLAATMLSSFVFFWVRGWAVWGSCGHVLGNLRMVPLSALGPETRIYREQENIKTLRLLGRWQTAEEIAANNGKKTAIMESSEELISYLDLTGLDWLDFCVWEQI